MKIRTDFVTNSSSSSFCVSLSIETNDGKKYGLRIDPHEMGSSGGMSDIYLNWDKYKDISGAKDIEELYDLLFESVDLKYELDDVREIAYVVCHYYGMDDKRDLYENELSNAPTSMDKLRVIRKIKDDYFDMKIKEIEESDDDPKEKEKKIKELQKERNEKKGPGLVVLFDELKDFRNQMINEVSNIDNIKNIILTQDHYAWGEFAPDSFWDIVDYDVCYDDTSCEGITFALSKKLSRNKKIKEDIEKHSGVISSRMNKNVNYLIANEDDEYDAKIGKAKEWSVPIISTSEFYEKFDSLLDPSDERVMARLREMFDEKSDFKGIILALEDGIGPCNLIDNVDICIDMKTGNIENRHIVEHCYVPR